MASIVSTGVGSGLDVAGIVQQLVAAEGQPVEARMGRQEARAQSQLSAFGSLKSALSDFRDKLDIMRSLSSFLARKASSSDEQYFTATADSDAQPASYSMQVVQLAQSQKLTSGAFASADAAVGTGTLQIAVGAAVADIEIDDENNTLAGIRDAINTATDNPGISASIVNADSGSYLILTADSTGAAQQMTINQSGGDGGLSALEYDPGMGLASLTESIAAQDALIRIDGLDVVSESNVFAGAVQGVTITVDEVTIGSETLQIENDEETARQTVGDFVEAYNTVIDTFDALTNYDAEAELASPLLGDASIRSIRDQLRREMSTAVRDLDAPFSMLGDVGIRVQLDGKLEIDDDTLNAVLESDFVRFGKLFSTTDGFAVRMFDLTDGFLATDGIIETRSEGLNKTIADIDDQREDLNDRLASLETRLLRRFNALDSLLAQLTSTSNFLADQLNNLPGIDRPGSNP